MTLAEYKQEIAAAQSKGELTDISYRAFLEDDNALSGKKTLYNKVVSACIARECELEDRKK